MKIIVFDTETTGFPSSSLSLEEQPYICQFAGIVYEYDFETGVINEIHREDQLIRPMIEIPHDSSMIHGITTEMVVNAPTFGEYASRLLEIFGRCDMAVAHNIAFDRDVIANELLRSGFSKDFLPEKTFDTMTSTKEMCRLPGRLGGYKSPKLAELHMFLFNKGFENAHNALADVVATGNCLQELLKRGVVEIDEPVQDTLF
jgi:DNA polymerase III epsilon subunit-like protein